VRQTPPARPPATRTPIPVSSMAQAAPPPATDPTRMEREDSAADGTGAQAAAAAAAAALVALPQAAAAAAGNAGQSQMRVECDVQCCPRCNSVHVVLPCRAHCCVQAVSTFPLVSTARLDPSGWPACELCGRRLSTVKHHRAYGPGRACHPRCKPQGKAAQDAAVSAAAAAAPLTPRKRRAESHPGELPAQATPPALTRRVTPPSPVPANKKQRITRQEERIMRLLDETHARRMAAEAAEAAAATASGAAHPRGASE
jgi:hypothetical protein